MKIFRWEHGRQGHGYSKFTLLYSKRLKIDAYFIVLPTCSMVPPHRDPTVPGYEHHRVNITARKPKVGGNTFIERRENHYYHESDRAYHFRPDAKTHYVTAILKGQLWLFSFGWLRKEK